MPDTTCLHQTEKSHGKRSHVVTAMVVNTETAQENVATLYTRTAQPTFV